MLGVEEQRKQAAFHRSIDIDPFIDRLEQRGANLGLRRCAEQTLCLDDGVLVYAVEPLLTPDGRALADVVVPEMEEKGVRIDRVQRLRQNVLGFAGSSSDAWLTGRIVADTGWLFLINAPDETASAAVVNLLDEVIAGPEGISLP